MASTRNQNSEDIDKEAERQYLARSARCQPAHVCVSLWQKKKIGFEVKEGGAKYDKGSKRKHA